jgi:hypothetical protein
MPSFLALQRSGKEQLHSGESMKKLNSTKLLLMSNIVRARRERKTERRNSPRDNPRIISDILGDMGQGFES